MSRDIFVCHTGGMRGCGNSTIGIWWVEARDASRHAIMHRTAPTTKNYPAQEANTAEVENSALQSHFRVCVCVCVYICWGWRGFRIRTSNTGINPPDTRIGSVSRTDHSALFSPALLGGPSTVAYPICLAKCWQ